MTRPNRIVVEGGVFHLNNRLSRGERVFDQEAGATRPVLISDFGFRISDIRPPTLSRNRRSRRWKPVADLFDDGLERGVSAQRVEVVVFVDAIVRPSALERSVER